MKKFPRNNRTPQRNIVVKIPEDAHRELIEKQKRIMIELRKKINQISPRQ
ncbi:hypothetical protein [Parageobacillus thermoglucosidasius]|nr:hypothetical protein [Parageobacillus thermoglucosidasius]